MEALRAELAKSGNVFLTGYEKLTVGQDFELAQDGSRRGRQL